MMKYLLIILLLIGGAVGFEQAYNHSPHSGAVLQREVSLPQRISIPAINVDAPVEGVGLSDATKAMDVPKDWHTVGWYTLGFAPGTDGSAVMSGHLDRTDGSPAVFYNLKNLKSGDKVMVKTADGKTQTYVVKEVATYPYNAVPLEKIFKGSKGLNLITCAGVWSGSNYSDRIVAYTTYEGQN